MFALLQRLTSGRERVATEAGLADFLAARAAFVSQKCTFDYCRARAGIGWAQLFRDDEFGRALQRSRWEAYAAVLADVGEVALVYLRHQGGDAAVVGRACRCLGRGPAPPPGPRPSRQLGRCRGGCGGEAAPRPAGRAARAVHRIGRKSGGVVFEVLPIHTNLKAHDREMVVNNVRFLLCRVYADMERELDGPALVRLLSVAGASGSPPAPR